MAAQMSFLILTEIGLGVHAYWRLFTTKAGASGKKYRLPTKEDYSAVWNAKKQLEQAISKSSSSPFAIVPDELLPPIGTLGFRVQRYGMLKWGDLFTYRQKLAMITWRNILNTVQKNSNRNNILEALSLVLSRVAMSGMSLTKWNAYAEKMQHVFGNPGNAYGLGFRRSSLLTYCSWYMAKCIEPCVRCSFVMAINSSSGSSSNSRRNKNTPSQTLLPQFGLPIPRTITRYLMPIFQIFSLYG